MKPETIKFLLQLNIIQVNRTLIKSLADFFQSLLLFQTINPAIHQLALASLEKKVKPIKIPIMAIAIMKTTVKIPPNNMFKIPKRTKPKITVLIIVKP
jgi:hypothetical protein